MKKLITFIIFSLLALVALAQDTTSTEPSGFAKFYDQYGTVLWIVLSAVGVSGFLWYRAARIRDAFDEIVKAGEDNSVSEAEFQAILKAFKAIWGKKE